MNITSLVDIIDCYIQPGDNRIAITGPPGSGKTSVSYEFECSVEDAEICHTDDTMHLPWSDQAEYWAKKLENKKVFLIEGVQVPRIIRKGLHVDHLFILPQYQINTEQQHKMWKGMETILKDLKCKRTTIARTIGATTA